MRPGVPVGARPPAAPSAGRAAQRPRAPSVLLRPGRLQRRRAAQGTCGGRAGGGRHGHPSAARPRPGAYLPGRARAPGAAPGQPSCIAPRAAIPVLSPPPPPPPPPPSPLRWDYAAICVNFAPRRAASSRGAAAPLSRGRGMSGACGRGCGLAAPCPPPRLPGPRAGDERGAEAASPCGSRERLAVPHRSVCGKFSGAFAHPNFGCGLAGKQMGERNNALNGNL